MVNLWIKNNHTYIAQLLYNNSCVVYEWTYNLLRVSVTYLRIPAECRGARLSGVICVGVASVAAESFDSPYPYVRRTRRLHQYVHHMQSTDRCVQTSALVSLVLFIVHWKHCEEMILPTFVLFARFTFATAYFGREGTYLWTHILIVLLAAKMYCLIDEHYFIFSYSKSPLHTSITKNL